MSLTLYHYVHCPFCVRVRMALGFVGKDYKSQVVPYNDEKTPILLTGKKMLPILKHDQGVMNESLDIMALVDKDNKLKLKELLSSGDLKKIEALLDQIGGPVHSLAMPYWIYTPEFDAQSRDYFQKKKEEKRGPFKNLVKNRDQYIRELSPILDQIQKDLKPFYQSENLSASDILIASHLWGLYIVPEYQFPEKIHLYLQNIKKICQFDYHQDFWS